MDAKKIQILLSTLKTGSFLKAADSLGYTPSGLTHMMDSLEKDIGITILKRGRFGICLTPEGEKLLPLFEDFAAAEQKIRNEVRSLQSRRQKIIRIGAYASIARNWLPSLLSGFYLEHPKVSIETVVLGREELYNALKKREVDMIFACSGTECKHDFVSLAKDYYRAVLPLGYPTAQETIFSLKEFEGTPFIMPSFMKDIDVQKALETNNISIEMLAASADDPVVLSMVSGGLGISMLSDLVLQGASEKVKIMPLEPNVSRILGIAVLSMQSLSPLVKNFIAYVKRHKIFAQ
ncbi:LysR family transcriptional regulator [Anaerospora hongkongensis]|uniref:LysR family transcriptional regulator n=1 Tax=Anaerospora hongkongensis TaxID=244830 RepID=UPI002898E7B7|nr:LysR family transcriptional regulator [Anaerospora hongkongensis]